MHTGLAINCKHPAQATVVILCAPYEKTASFRKGTSRAPEAIVSCITTQIETWDRFTNSLPSPGRKVALRRLRGLDRLSPERMVSRVEREYSRLSGLGPFIVLLGGEHSVSTGAFQAIASLTDAEDITICQIDAHLDLREDDSDYSDAPHGRYAHSTVMRRAVELGFRAVNVGARAYSKEEMEFAQSKGVLVHEWGTGSVPSAKDIVASISTDAVYLTIDADGIDPSHLPATGTPVQGGLEWYFTIDLLREIFRRKNVIGVDLVEVAPRPNDVVSEYGAAQLCYTMLAMRELYSCGVPNRPAKIPNSPFSKPSFLKRRKNGR